MCVSSSMWHRQVALLSANSTRYSLLLIDNRGSGESTLAKGGYDLETMARDAWGVVDVVFGRGTRVHIVGHSMGSFMALRAAVMGEGKKGREGRVRSLSVFAANIGGWFWSNVPSAGLTKAVVGLWCGGGIDKVTADVYMGLHYTQKFLNGSDSEGVRRARYLKKYLEGVRSDRKLGESGGDVFWRHLDAARGHHLSDDDIEALKKGRYPKLVVYGKEDVVVVPQACVELGEKVNAQVVGVDGAHFMVEESDEEVTELLRLQIERARDLENDFAMELDELEMGNKGDEGKEWEKMV